MRCPKLSKTQQTTLMMALIKTRKLMRKRALPLDLYLYAIKREINTVQVLARLDLVCIQLGPWNRICTHYNLTDAGWILAQALLDAKTQRIARSVIR